MYFFQFKNAKAEKHIKKEQVIKFLTNVLTFSWTECIFRNCNIQICLIGTAAKIVAQGKL